MESARRGQQRGHEPLVDAQASDHNFPHWLASRSSSRRRSSEEAVRALRRGLITISHSGTKSLRRRRNISRKRLFTRFLTTAFPRARGRVKPKRGPWLSGTLRQNAVKYWPAIRFPWVYALRKSEVLRIRLFFRKRSGGASVSGVEAATLCVGRKSALLGVPDGSLVADREFMAALGAAARQNGSPVFGAHAHPKPMGLGPFTVVWLKCTFWH